MILHHEIPNSHTAELKTIYLEQDRTRKGGYTSSVLIESGCTISALVYFSNTLKHEMSERFGKLLRGIVMNRPGYYKRDVG